MAARRPLGWGLTLLAAGLAANSLLGPLAAGAIDYHVTTLLRNQTIGLDGVSLAVVAPLALVAAILVLRGHRAGPVLALGPAVYAAYMFPQYVLGPDYRGLEGNNELFFPLHLGLFVLGGALALAAWSASSAERLRPSRRLDRLGAVLLLVLGLFLAIRWFPALLDATSGRPTGVDYLEGPTFFWTIALLDLGIALPVSVAAGLALGRGDSWARKALYGIVAWFALVGLAVAGMNVAYHVNDDPNASAAALIAFSAFALVFTTIAALLYRPLFTVSRRLAASDATSLGGGAGSEAYPGAPGGEVGEREQVGVLE